MLVTKVKYTSPAVVKEVAVSVPEDWGMFSAAGNQSLRNKALRLIAEVEVAGPNMTALTRAFAKFYRGWRSLHYTKTMEESADTAVRTQVRGFSARVAEAIGWDEGILDKIWDSADAHPKHRG